MYFTKIAAVLSLAASALAMPTGEVQKRALTFRKYADFQISSGTAGNALAEAQAKFPIGSNLASVSASDLAIIQAARETAEAAETDAFVRILDFSHASQITDGSKLPPLPTVCSSNMDLITPFTTPTLDRNRLLTPVAMKNDQIDAASGTAADSLQNGKIKNKVLKLFLETTALQIQQAQGSDNQDKIDEEQKKLNNNIALDKKAAGQASTAVTFTGDVQPNSKN